MNICHLLVYKYLNVNVKRKSNSHRFIMKGNYFIDVKRIRWIWITFRARSEKIHRGYKNILCHKCYAKTKLIGYIDVFFMTQFLFKWGAPPHDRAWRLRFQYHIRSRWCTRLKAWGRMWIRMDTMVVRGFLPTRALFLLNRRGR